MDKKVLKVKKVEREEGEEEGGEGEEGEEGEEGGEEEGRGFLSERCGDRNGPRGSSFISSSISL